MTPPDASRPGAAGALGRRRAVDLPALLLIGLSVTLSAIAQILLKLGMSGEAVGAALANGDARTIAWTMATTAEVLLGLGLYGLGAVSWLLVLARVDVTQAYPFVGLGFLLTMALGAVILGETVTPVRLLGTVLVAVGVLLVSRS